MKKEIDTVMSRAVHSTSQVWVTENWDELTERNVPGSGKHSSRRGFTEFTKDEDINETGEPESSNAVQSALPIWALTKGPRSITSHRR